MSPSATLGQSPISSNDKLIYRAILEVDPFGIQEGLSNLHQISPYTGTSSMIIGSSFAIALALLITGSRLWIRAFRLRNFGADDIVIIPALAGCVAYIALNIASESAGCLGKNAHDCTYEGFGLTYTLARFNFSIFYFTVFLVKISIVLQNRRMTGMTSKRWQVAHWTYLALVICLLPICVCLNIFPCSPIATQFSLQAIAKVPNPRNIKCLDQDAISLSTRNLHIITDWLLLPVPLIIIWRLQMPVSRKIRLMLVFAVGLVSSVASIFRNVYTARITVNTSLSNGYYQILAWDTVDIFFATVVASLPALNGIVDASFSRLKSWGSTSSILSFAKLRTFVPSPQSSKGYNTRLSDKEPGISSNGSGAVDAKGKNPRSPDQPDRSILVRQSVDIELQRPLKPLQDQAAF